jgi:hypothetical protein
MPNEERQMEIIVRIREIEEQLKDLGIELQKLAIELNNEDFEEVVRDIVARLEINPSEQDSLREATNYLEFMMKRRQRHRLYN